MILHYGRGVPLVHNRPRRARPGGAMILHYGRLPVSPTAPAELASVER